MPVSQATAVMLYIHVVVISINSSTQKQKKGLTNYFHLTEYLQQSNTESPFVSPVQQRNTSCSNTHIYIYIYKEFITILGCKTYKESFWSSSRMPAPFHRWADRTSSSVTPTTWTHTHNRPVYNCTMLFMSYSIHSECIYIYITPFKCYNCHFYFCRSLHCGTFLHLQVSELL